MSEDGAVPEEQGAMQKVRRSKCEVRLRKCGAVDDDVLPFVAGVGFGEGEVVREDGGGVNHETH